MDNQQGRDLEASFDSFKEGRVLSDRYELLLPLAKGGMGTVWIARLKGARGFRKLVAVKTISHGIDDGTCAMEEMLTQEANIVSQIRHPNVVETIELGECSGSMYLAMELVQGETLAYVLKAATAAGGLPLNVAVNLIGQVCRGLHAAHELRNQRGELLGVVHRDVTPQNILVSFSGVAKLADFGIVKVGAEESYTRTGEVKGKLSYVTPEQLKQIEVDRRSDIFCLGVLLYLLTTGEHPFKDTSVQTTCLNILNNEPLPPSSLVDGYSTNLEEVVLKALAKDRNERQGTAAELCEALEQAVPEAFTPAAVAEVSSYINTLLADRVAQRNRLIQRAEEMIEKSGPATSSGIVRKPAANTTIPIGPKTNTFRTHWRAPLFLLSAIVGVGVLYAAMRPVQPKAIPAPLPSARPTPKANVGEYAPMVVMMGPAPSAEAPAPVPVPTPTLTATWKPAPRKQKTEVKAEEAVEEAPEPAPVVETPVAEEAPKSQLIARLLPEPPPPAPEVVGPKNVPSKVGHALLDINPSADAYRPSVPSYLRSAEGFSTPVRICVNPSGLVKSVQVLRSQGELIDQKIVNALARWHYRPLLIDGRPKPFCYPLIYSF